MASQEPDATEKITEIELLKLSNAVLNIENRLLRLKEAERSRDLLVLNILRGHGFRDNAIIRLEDGTIQGEKIGTENSDDDQQKAI
jgi:hypothetical protein